MTDKSVDKYRRATDTVTAAGTVFLALTVAVTAWGIHREESKSRMQRTLYFLNSAYTEDEQQRIAMLEEFPNRWKPQITEPLSKDEAQNFFDVSTEPKNTQHHRWNVARKHLNNLEPLAFAYAYDLADPKIIAANACGLMTRSYQYFKELIDLFREKLGPGQSWQVIPRVVNDMNDRYRPECARAE